MSRELRSTSCALQQEHNNASLSESEIPELDLACSSAAENEIAEASEAVSDIDSQPSGSSTDDDDNDDVYTDAFDDSGDDSGSDYNPNASDTTDGSVASDELDSAGSDCTDSLCSETDSVCSSDVDGPGSSDGDLLQQQYASLDESEARAGYRPARMITITGPVTVTYIAV